MILDPLTIQAIKIFIGPAWGLLLMFIGYQIFDTLTPFDTGLELRNGNIAIGIVVCGILGGVGLCVGLSLAFALF